MAVIAACDPQMAQLIADEAERQAGCLELIASENFASSAVMAATGSMLTNKYAEGPWGRRYYGGCQVVDRVEALAAERACALFGAEYANLQPHSGTQANMAVFMQFLQPGDTILAMDLAAGGHLTHGSPANFSGRLYRAVGYGVRPDTQCIDYDEVRALALEHRPKLLIAGASAYPRSLDFERFGAIAKEVGALFLADIAHIAGLVAAGCHPSPVPHADFVTTTTHKTLRGPRGGLILARKEHARALDVAVCPRTQGGPLMHVIAAKGVALHEAAQPGFIAYQQEIQRNARALGEQLIERGLALVTGGTDNHLVLVDLRPWGITGKVAELALDRVNITTNKNQIPFDPQRPMIGSGIRLGTPAVTTRGMGPAQMRQIADLVADCLAAAAASAGPADSAASAGAAQPKVSAAPDDAVHAGLRARVAALTAEFPLLA